MPLQVPKPIDRFAPNPHGIRMEQRCLQGTIYRRFGQTKAHFVHARIDHEINDRTNMSCETPPVRMWMTGRVLVVTGLRQAQFPRGSPRQPASKAPSTGYFTSVIVSVWTTASSTIMREKYVPLANSLAFHTTS